MKITKVLIVDDSMLMRAIIKDILQAEAQFEVIATANNGYDAYLQTLHHHPDVVLMDMQMGDYNGIYGIKQIMQHCPTPIIILSAIGNSNMDLIMEGLHLGAVDYLNKPAKNSMKIREIGSKLISKIKQAKKMNLMPKVKSQRQQNTHEHSFDENMRFDCIVIGASTGGPTAIERIVTTLPANIPVPVIIIQHMPQHFLPSFAQRLDRLTPLKIKLIKRFDTIEKGTVHLVPAQKNCILKWTEERTIQLDHTRKTFKAYNFPSIDSVMQSVAEIYQERCIGVILTGMGTDGSEGMAAIKAAGGYTIAQSEDSCVVYGMPRAAVEANIVDNIVKLDDMSGFLVSCLS